MGTPLHKWWGVTFLHTGIWQNMIKAEVQWLQRNDLT